MARHQLRLVSVLLFAFGTANAATYVSPAVQSSTEVIVRFNFAARGWTDAASLVARVRQRDDAVLAVLGSPLDARILVPLRINPSLLKLMSPDDPRVRLHDAIVLIYPNQPAADFAEKRLRSDATALEVERGRAYQFASTPNDPLFVNGYVGSDPQKYQWGSQILNMSSAWDKQRGYGYVGLLDNGIQIHGMSGEGIHADLRANYRPQFSYNFGYSNNGVYDDSAHGNPRQGGGSNSPDNLDEEPYNLVSGGAIVASNIAGHGTHTAGIIAAQPNDSLGVAGGCQACSLALGRVTAWDAVNQQNYPESTYAAAGVTWMTNLGVQAINMSFMSLEAGFSCTATPLTCASLDAAAAHDVAIIAAAGNERFGAPGNGPAAVDFPASYPGVIAVAGAQYDISGAAFWDGAGNFGSNRSSRTDIAAPAASVISSIYTNSDWSSLAPCGDSFPASYALGYGDCTGTSMAAPHVTAVIELYRSTKPTASLSEVKTALTSNVSACAGSLASYCGAGIPDAARLVAAALGGRAAINRLTPLFSFYSSDRYDHLYTTVPQMATAAILGTILPVSYTHNQFSYSSIGPLSPGYSAFPGVPLTGCGFSPPCDPLYPRALFSVFTSFKNPLPSEPDLVPLYRLSYACLSSVPSFCSNHEHVSHVYATDTSETWVSTNGYSVDGIEGYVYPKTSAQPAGAVKLCRRYNPAHDDYILFPGAGATGTDCSAHTDGYTPGGANYTDPVVSTDWIGWVYPLSAPRAVLSRAVIVPLLDD